VDAHFAFHGTALSGTPQIRERWKRGVALVEGLLGEAAGRMYVAEHYPPQSRERMDELVGNVIAAFRQRIAELEWMGPQTRERALDKLDAFRPKIGHPQTWRDYSTYELDAGDLVGNVRRGRAFDTDRDLAKVGGPIDRDEWLMTPQTVNAYYHPMLNEIVFPAAILQPPFFTVDADDAVNYGGIGAVIAHEIGHGFDDQGSRYAGDGSLTDWWTGQDRAAFEERAQRLVRQFDGLAPREAPDRTVNGGLTVGENIGDLCGLEMALAAYRIASGGDAPWIEQWSGEQRFFLGWAQVWRGKARVEEARRLIAIDPHAPADLRGNTVRNVDAFHEAFGCAPGDGLWLDPSERVRIF
jgi:putative endopeptidase